MSLSCIKPFTISIIMHELMIIPIQNIQLIGFIVYQLEKL